MSCTVCGSTSRCGCRSRVTAGSTCACVACTSGTGACQNCGPASAVPYYQCAGASPQQHGQKIIIETLNAAVRVANSWNVPICGGQATLSIPGLALANPGSYLFKKGTGWFEIISFDASTEEVVVQNNCTDGNAAPGTTIPACTVFTVTGPPSPNANANANCVAIDFTAPDVDDCIDITLTSTSGIATGDTVAIGTGYYFVSDVKPNDIITICNKGEGITPGTSVIALDAAGNYQYCLDIISTNNCERDPVLAGSVVVCDESITQPLQSLLPLPIRPLVEAVILTGTDRVEAEYQPLDTEIRSCTTFDVAWNILNGTATYVLDVNAPSVFSTGNLLEVPGVSQQITVTAVGASTIDVTLSPTPSGNLTIPVNTWICVITCCDYINQRIEEINDITDLEALQTGGADPGVLSDNIIIGPTSLVMPTANNWVISNTYDRDIKIQIQLQTEMFLAISNLSFLPGPCVVQLDQVFYRNGVPTVSSQVESVYQPGIAEPSYVLFQSVTDTFFVVDTLVPGQTITYQQAATLRLVDVAHEVPDTSVQISSYSIDMTYVLLPS